MYKQNILNLILSYTGMFLGIFNTLIKPKVLSPEEIGLIAFLMSSSAIFNSL